MKQLLYYIKTDKAEYFLYHSEEPLSWQTELIRRPAMFPVFQKSILESEIHKAWVRNGSFDKIMVRIVESMRDHIKISRKEVIIFKCDYIPNYTGERKTILER